jgi:hypothetical protein
MNVIDKFVAQWGFCPHLDQGLCVECSANPSQRSFSQGDALTLGHQTQIAIFNFCGCEEGEEQWYNDCPKED